jgi:hypothetical protein
MGEMPAFARKWRDEHRGQWFTVPKLSGFCLLMADPMKCAARWERIDLLHLDIEPECQDVARRWLKEYANRCHAIAVHHAHHPAFRLGPVIAELAATDQWQLFEYSGNLAGWTVLVRRSESCPDDNARAF